MDERICEELSRDAFSVIPHFLQAAESSALYQEAKSLNESGLLRRAGVGRGSSLGIHDEVRRDEILWWQESDLSPIQRAFWERLQDLKKYLNQTLFLGLQSLEGHYAIYPPGGFYERHVDRFRDDDTRVLSVVAYFNRDWKSEYGGQLRLFPEHQSIDVMPEEGTLVCFLSDQIPHEVCPTLHHRVSFAGWFRRK